MSSYEDRIIEILKKEKISFVREKTFSDCRGGKYRFDFWLPALNILLEMDGEYHFKEIRGLSVLKRQKEHDRRKNSYCLAKSIPLYRIPYFDLNTIQSAADLFKPQYLVKDKWHNDRILKNV